MCQSYILKKFLKFFGYEFLCHYLKHWICNTKLVGGLGIESEILGNLDVCGRVGERLEFEGVMVEVGRLCFAIELLLSFLQMGLCFFWAWNTIFMYELKQKILPTFFNYFAVLLHMFTNTVYTWNSKKSCIMIKTNETFTQKCMNFCDAKMWNECQLKYCTVINK